MTEPTTPTALTGFALCIRRPIATSLVAVAATLLGVFAFMALPVSPLPEVEFPTIAVQASYPGADPETIAATVAAPLERVLGSIPGVTELTSTSTLGSTRIILQFDLSRRVDAVAREVQAAIYAARAQLPSGMPTAPSYRKVNPADAPVMAFALTHKDGGSDLGKLYDIADTLLAQKIAQVEGVGQVQVGGGALPAIRVAVDPARLTALGLGPLDVRNAITSANLKRPQGMLTEGEHAVHIVASDQLREVADYRDMVIAHRHGVDIRLGDVGQVSSSVQDVRSSGFANGRPGVMLLVYRQPGANVIATVERVKALLPRLSSVIPASVELTLMMDRTPTIRASLAEVERSLLISALLVVVVVWLFVGDLRAALAPGVAVPVSLVTTFALMQLFGFTLNVLSLMALTIVTGFVVDDAVVVLENTMRRIEHGEPPLLAAENSAREVGFTVVAMSLSLIAVFLPILLMGGIVGRLFFEFAMTLTLAILVSLVVSLTLTPMMCAHLLRPQATAAKPNGVFNRLHEGYRRSLDWTLAHPKTILVVLLLTVVANVALYVVVPKGFFPQQDSGRLMGMVRADQAISFQAMRQKMLQLIEIVRADPAVANVGAFTGGGQRNTGFMFVALKPVKERGVSADAVIARLRGRLAQVAGASLYLQSAQDLRIGGRPGAAQYQYTLQSEDYALLRQWEPKIKRALSEVKSLADVSTDQDDRGVQVSLHFDRERMSALGISQRQVDVTLGLYFGQSLVSTIYNAQNQYRVVLEADAAYLTSPESLAAIYVTTSSGKAVPLSAFSRWAPSQTALSVNHQNQFAATTVSFNLPPSVPLSQATADIDKAISELGSPQSIQGGFQGAAKAFQRSMSSQPLLILAAIVVVYLVLGILYEHLIHPITILSTLPSAGVGALLALLVFRLEFTVIAFIGVILLIGIVKKNAIMMVDFAIARRPQLSAQAAIREACLIRFRPIMMTTMAALFGALPLALSSGDGAETRQPLGIAIVGGLMLSQLLTLYTTPVVYLLLDRLGERLRRLTPLSVLRQRSIRSAIPIKNSD